MNKDTAPLLSVRMLRVHFPRGRHWPWSQPEVLKAVDGVNFDLRAGETLGVVGESGCGKSTLARSLIGLQPVTQGSILFEGQELTMMDPAGWKKMRRDIQIVFQDPLASLNPRMTLGEIVAEPMINLRPELDRKTRWKRVMELLERVGLGAEHINRYPHEFSGGQCQRIGIARALSVEPRLLICDEAVSALDVTIQAQVLALLDDLQREFNLAMLFISHDMAVVHQISHRVMVMYFGKVVEVADRDDLFANPKHRYTQALLSAVPVPDPRQERLRQRMIYQSEAPPVSGHPVP